MRIKLLVPSGHPKHAGLLAHCQLVDADTGKDLLGGTFRNVELHFPFHDGGPDAVHATVEILIAEIEAVPRERMAEVFPGYVHQESVSVRGPTPAPEASARRTGASSGKMGPG